MLPLKSLLTCLALVLPGSTFAQDMMTADEKEAVIVSIREAIAANYVFEDRVERINASLADLHASGKYRPIRDRDAFADTLTEDLVAITDDQHFALVHNPGFIAARRASRARRTEEQPTDQQANDEQPVMDWNLWYAARDNYGFERVEILPGNVGYIKLDFFQPLSWMQSTFDASMGFVANTDALIIDLSGNGGGYSPSDAYIASYFFEQGDRLWSSTFNRPSGETSSVFLFEEVNGERYLDRAVFVLVSENTFSLAESLAYGLKHFDRATIVGQNSAGAAHAIDIAELDDSFFLQVPVSYNIHPVTKTDWEGTGVVPQIEAAPESALQTAHLLALDELIETATAERIRNFYQKARNDVAPSSSDN